MVLVSVIIPVYNQERYLPAAIDSVLAQTFRDYELIVVDDGSTDGTPAIIRSYGARLRSVRKPNGGCASALNRGIQEARGEWIAWLSSDDLWEPDKLRRQVEVIGERPEVGLVFTDDLRIDSEGDVVGELRTSCPRTRLGRQLRMVRGCYINGCTTLIRREVFEVVGLFDEEDRFALDYDLWFRIVREVEITHIPEPLVRYRIHPGQTSSNRTAMRTAGRRVLIRGLRRMGAWWGAVGVALHLLDQGAQIPWRAKNLTDGGDSSTLGLLRDAAGILGMLIQT